MKIKKIDAICKRDGVYHLNNKIDRDGVVTQWLGNGCALYPLLGAPLLDEKSLCTMLDITEKKRDNLTIQCREMPEEINTNDIDSRDIRLEREEIAIQYEGMTILPLRGEDGIICIQEKYLEPLDDEKDLLELYSRTTAVGTYVVVKAGMMVRGLISPLMMRLKTVEKLEAIARECKEEIMKKKGEQKETGEDVSDQ